MVRIFSSVRLQIAVFFANLPPSQEAPIVFQPQRSIGGVQMLQKPMTNHMSFLSTRSYNSRPLSEATEIFDTDYEAEYSPADDSPRRSVESVSQNSSDSLIEIANKDAVW